MELAAHSLIDCRKKIETSALLPFRQWKRGCMVQSGYESYKTVAKERIKDDLVQSGSKATKASVDREAKKRWSKLPDSSREIWAKGGSK